MLTKEDFEKLITSIKEKLDETSQALVSEDLLGVLSSYSSAMDEVASLGEKIGKLETDNAELLKVNGRKGDRVRALPPELHQLKGRTCFGLFCFSNNNAHYCLQTSIPLLRKELSLSRRVRLYAFCYSV